MGLLIERLAEAFSSSAASASASDRNHRRGPSAADGSDHRRAGLWRRAMAGILPNNLRAAIKRGIDHVLEQHHS